MELGKIVVKDVSFMEMKCLNLKAFPNAITYFMVSAEESPIHKFFVAQHGKEVIGAAILMQTYKDIIALSYLFVPKEFREQGIGKLLLEKASDFVKELKLVLKVGIIPDQANIVPMMYLLQMQNFVMREPAMIYISNVSRSEVRAELDQFVSGRVTKMIDRFTRQGFQVASFREAPADILDNLKKCCETGEYPENFNPFAIVGRRLDPDFSFVCWNSQNVPAAFCACLRFGNILINEMGAAHRDFRGNGCIIIPMHALYRAILKDLSVKQLKAFVYRSNTASRQCFEKENAMIGKLYDDKKLFFNYFKFEENHFSAAQAENLFQTLPPEIQKASTPQEAFQFAAPFAKIDDEAFERFVNYLIAKERLAKRSDADVLNENDTNSLAGW